MMHIQDQYFKLKAILLWTINDFPAYDNLCGCMIKGYHACPIYGKNTSSVYLLKGRKMAYVGHRKFLPHHHPYKKQKKVFNGAQELGSAPEPLSGEEILVQTITFICNSCYLWQFLVFYETCKTCNCSTMLLL